MTSGDWVEPFYLIIDIGLWRDKRAEMCAGFDPFDIRLNFYDVRASGKTRYKTIRRKSHSFIHFLCVCVWSIHPSTDGRTGLVRYIHTDQLFAVNAIRLHIIICVDAMMLVDSKHTWFLILVGCCYLIVCVCFFLCWPIRTLDWIKNNKRKKAPPANAIDCNGNRQITTMA